jgi:hypothetical protein
MESLLAMGDFCMGTYCGQPSLAVLVRFHQAYVFESSVYIRHSWVHSDVCKQLVIWAVYLLRKWWEWPETTSVI